MKIGLGITTRNRGALLKKILPLWTKSLEEVKSAICICFDDNGRDLTKRTSSREGKTDFISVYSSSRLGIAKAKNICMDKLIAQGCTHVFLVDDDVLPLRGKWWEIFTSVPIEHMGHWTIEHTERGPQLKGQTNTFLFDEQVELFTDLSGILLYFTGKALDLRYNPNYSAYGFEHMDMSIRQMYHLGHIKATGFAHFVPTRISEYIYSLDFDRNVFGRQSPLFFVEDFPSSVQGENVSNYIEQGQIVFNETIEKLQNGACVTKYGVE